MPAQMIIDTDTHISEPPDLWTSRLPASMGDAIMQVRWSDKFKAEVWTANGRIFSPAWAAANHRWPDSLPTTPKRQEDAPAASYDASARLAAMDEAGIQIAALFPSAGIFTFDTAQSGSKEVTIAHIRAYNDFLLDWTSVAPHRFIPLAVIPYWWVDEAVAEVKRTAALGHRGVVTTGAPHLHGLPYLSDPRWNPLWSVCQDLGMSVNLHCANAGTEALMPPDRYVLDGEAVTYARSTIGFFLDNGHQINDLLLSGVLARFPTLTFASVESGIGWLPFLLESSDYYFKRAKVRREHPEFGDALPSDLFRRQVYANYWYERLEQWHVDAIGEDNILFGTDFPHPMSLYGSEVQDAINNGLQSQPDSVRQKILWKNAARLYGVDPVAGQLDA